MAAAPCYVGVEEIKSLLVYLLKEFVLVTPEVLLEVESVHSSPQVIHTFLDLHPLVHVVLVLLFLRARQPHIVHHDFLLFSVATSLQRYHDHRFLSRIEIQQLVELLHHVLVGN
jgi:hypothetical protein